MFIEMFGYFLFCILVGSKLSIVASNRHQTSSMAHVETWRYYDQHELDHKIMCYFSAPVLPVGLPSSSTMKRITELSKIQEAF